MFKLRHVDSSMIRSVQAAASGGQIIEFSDGRKYRYPNMTQDMADELVNADSAGRWFNENVRGELDGFPE